MKACSYFNCNVFRRLRISCNIQYQCTEASVRYPAGSSDQVSDQ